jgi:hypothetical protein
MIVAGLTLGAVGPTFLSFLKPGPGSYVDFFQEWSSATNYFRALPVYTNLKITTPLYLKLDHYNPALTTIEFNAHPPTAVLLALPFAAFDYSNAVLAWNLISLALLGMSLFLIVWQLSLPVSSFAILILVAVLCSSGPLLMQVLQGQLNLILLWLLTLVWVADRTDRPYLAGCFLGAAVAIKLFPAFLFLYFISTGRWKTVVGGLLSFLVLNAFTAGVLGTQVYRDYYVEVIPRVSEFRSNWRNASLIGFWTKLFCPVTVGERVEPLWRSKALGIGGVFLSFAFLVPRVARIAFRARTREERDKAFGLFMTTMLLLSPITWDHSLLLLAIPIAVIWVSLPRSREPWMIFAAVLVALWLIPFPLYLLFVPGGPAAGTARPLHTLTILSYQFYGLLGLFSLGIFVAIGGNADKEQPKCPVIPIDPGS